MPRFCFIGFLLLGLCLFGCSQNKTSGKVSVSGSVSLKGTPLADGVIQFEPLEKQSTSAAVPLVGGNYSISAANGLQPGMYLVRVTTSEEESKPVNPDAPLTPSGENLPGSGKTEAKKPVIPPEWGSKSKQQVEVKADGSNKFDFDIK
jgi:hypothetical protein